MSLFAEASAVGDIALDVIHGEAVTIEPKLEGNGRGMTSPADDPANPPFAAVGIVDVAAAVNRTPQPSSRGSQPPDVVVAQSTADFAAAQFTPATLPRKGWTLVLAERPGRPRYGIDLAKPDGATRLVCTITFRGNSA